MHIYNDEDLYNQYVAQQAEEALQYNSIALETHKNILEQHPVRLYTPNYFIRIALGLLTIVAVTFSAILLGLVFGLSSEAGGIAFCILMAFTSYVALELLVKGKHYYNAGVDNILMVFTVGFFVSAFLISNTESALPFSFAALVLCLYLSARFVDSFMAAAGYISLLAVVFLLYIKFGSIAKATAPFFMMMVSAISYFLINGLTKEERLLFYRNCFMYVKLLALFSFYASANYYVVKEVSNSMFDLKLTLADPIPFGWLFWILTTIVPPAYIAYGIKKKDVMFIRTGLVLVAASIFTYRYYYAVVPAEIAMLIGGAALIVVSYALIRLLKVGKLGYIFKKEQRATEVTVLETLITTQAFGKKVVAETDTEFGGGSFGGGGAGSKY